MKFTIKKSDVINVLSNIQGLTGRKSGLAITENLLIKTEGQNIHFIVTDLETGFEGFYPSKIEKEGNLIINARKFYEIVRDFPDEEIKINEIENNWIEIGNNNVEYHIVGMNYDDFPEIPDIKEVDFFEINSQDLKRMIEKTVIVTGSTDDKRAHIVGNYFDIINKEDINIVRMVSTDGSRLSKDECIFDKSIKIPSKTEFIIPKKGLIEVSKFLESEKKIKIGFKENHFITKKENETIIIRLLEGEFPQYIDIIKKGENNIPIKMEKQIFLMMLKRMSILSSENYKGVIFNFSKEKLIINSTNPEIGESKEEMAIDFKGEPIEVAFNPKYFIEALNAIEESKVVLNIINEEKPCLVEGEKDNRYLSAVMPMRI